MSAAPRRHSMKQNVKKPLSIVAGALFALAAHGQQKKSTLADAVDTAAVKSAFIRAGFADTKIVSGDSSVSVSANLLDYPVMMFVNKTYALQGADTALTITFRKFVRDESGGSHLAADLQATAPNFRNSDAAGTLIQDNGETRRETRFSNGPVEVIDQMIERLALPAIPRAVPQIKTHQG